MYQYTDFLSDINTNVSKVGTEKYIKNKLFKKEKTFFMPNGIQMNQEKNYQLNNSSNKKLKSEFNLKPDTFIGLAVGRFVEAKDYFNLIDSINKLSKKTANFIILIAGEGKLRANIESKINTLNLKKHIKLLGIRNDILTLMKNADCFIMSSAWEGLPIVILEAASVGLPAIVTDVGGNKEVIEDGKNGYVISAKNSNQLCNTIEKMSLLTKTKRAKMGEYSRNKINDQYEIGQIVNKWLKLYER